MFMLENKLVVAIIIVVASWFASFIVTFLLSVLEKFTSKTRSSLDDRLLDAAKLPIRYLSIIIGFYYATLYCGLEWEWQKFGLQDFFFSLGVLLVSFTISRMLKTFFNWYNKKETSAHRGKKTMFIFVSKIVSASVYVFAVLIILSSAQIDIRPMLAGLGVAGLAIALGLQEPMANLFAALFLVMDKSINIGDYIQLDDGTKAYIEDISWRSVRIRTIGGNTVIVPNSKFVSQNISSYDYPESPMSTSISVGVSYDSDLEFVEEVAIRVGKKIIEQEKISVKDNNPIVRYKSFAESSIDLIVIIMIDKVQDEGRVQHSFIKAIHKEFNKEKIEIPFPQRVVKEA